MTRPGVGGPGPSPWIREFADALQRVIRITLPFNTTTLALQNGSVFRDAACIYTKIYIGVGPDGTVETTPTQFLVPAGTTTLTTSQLSAKGLNTINNVIGLQITAGP